MVQPKKMCKHALGGNCEHKWPVLCAAQARAPRKFLGVWYFTQWHIIRDPLTLGIKPDNPEIRN